MESTEEHRPSAAAVHTTAHAARTGRLDSAVQHGSRQCPAVWGWEGGRGYETHLGNGKCFMRPEGMNLSEQDARPQAGYKALHPCTSWYKGGGGAELPEDNFDGDYFGKGNFRHLQES